MIILGLETSCDETGAAILEKKGNRIQILSNIVASSASLQEKFGGIIPEQAAREQIKSIIPVVQEALRQASLTQGSSVELDAIAVTYGPGLIGSLLVGVETAKTLALIWEKPLVPINHLIGHFYANWIGHNPAFPILGLLVSGGHTDLVLFTGHGKYQYLGGTRDDAAGECFDKCARLLGLPYPGGPEISKLASQVFDPEGSDRRGDALRVRLPRPMIDEDNFDFSFSGLKTAVANLVKSSEFRVRSKNKNSTNYKQRTNNLAASIEVAIVDVLVTKTLRAARKYGVKQIMIAGGVAANQKLISNFKFQISNLRMKVKLFVPPPHLCTDNGAMIAAAAFFEKPVANILKVQADPNISLG